MTVFAADKRGDQAIQAIQQAADPSAAIGAYASGFAVDGDNPRLYDAYISRMVDFGLPEMAYHQAQTLTTLQANNGLAWGVVAYVDARRVQMPEAVSAINLAGQFAPDNKFVQHTAGELVAWYDFKADKGQIPENVRDGLVKLRDRLSKQPEFAEAYGAAQKAYQTQPASTAPPSQGAPAQSAGSAVIPTQEPVAPTLAPGVAPAPPGSPADQIAPLGYGSPPQPDAYYYPPADYYPDYSGAYLDWGPDYYYAWGPGWVAPAAWCWWYPCGFWTGCSFYPFGVSFAFGDFHDFHHFHHHGFDHGGDFGHGSGFAHSHDFAAWHNNAQGHNAFFGSPAHPSAATLRSARTTAAVRSPSGTASGLGGTWWKSGSTLVANSAARSPQPLTPARSGSYAGQGTSLSGAATTHGSWNVASSRTGAASRTAPTFRQWAGSYASPGYRSPAYRAPSYSAPRYAMGNGGSFHGYGSWHGSAMSAAPRGFSGFRGGFATRGSSHGGFGGGGFRGAGAAGFHGGGGGGGFHGGGGVADRSANLLRRPFHG